MNKKNIVIKVFIVLFILLIVVFTITKIVDIPFLGITSIRFEEYNIGICSLINNKLPLRFIDPQGIKNPVLTAKDVTDRDAFFVADPFLVNENGLYYMFFEILSEDNGDIGLAISKNGFDWKYQKVVLDEPFHLSYPLVFKQQDKYYMLPETYEKSSIRLYEAVNFPYKWKLVNSLLEGRDFVDSTIFYYRNKWWIFTAMTDSANLFLYYADNLKGPWTEHVKSPVITGDKNIARPGGNVIYMEDKLIRIAQDDFPSYGNAVRAFEIITLNTDDYEERELEESPVLEASGQGWNKNGMHHLSLVSVNNEKWIAAVDGKSVKKKYILYVDIPMFLAKFWEDFQK